MKNKKTPRSHPRSHGAITSVPPQLKLDSQPHDETRLNTLFSDLGARQDTIERKIVMRANTMTMATMKRMMIMMHGAVIAELEHGFCFFFCFFLFPEMGLPRAPLGACALSLPPTIPRSSSPPSSVRFADSLPPLNLVGLRQNP